MSLLRRPSRKTVRRLIAGCLAVFVVGEVCELVTARPFVPPAGPNEPVVRLCYARLPPPLAVAAVHYWFAAFDPGSGRWHRREVWPHAFPDPNTGHVGRDLFAAGSGIGGGPARVQREWRGRSARDLLAVLEDPTRYPYRHTYLAWPGPNSNTYVAWALREAGAEADLHPTAIGKDFLGVAGYDTTPARTGGQFETPLVGLKAGADDGLEVHVLCLTLGLDASPPALKTPLGRFGAAE